MVDVRSFIHTISLKKSLTLSLPFLLFQHGQLPKDTFVKNSSIFEDHSIFTIFVAYSAIQLEHYKVVSYVQR